MAFLRLVRGAVLLPLCLLLFSGLAARAADTPETADPKVLSWGADAQSDAPYAFADPKDTSKLIGFEAEIIEAVAAHMGRTARHVQNDYDSLIPGLNRRLYDVVINGIEITPDHAEEVDFSAPYYTTFEQLAVRRDTNGINTLDDLAGKRVGTLKASLAERMLRDRQGVQVLVYDEEVGAYSDLGNGRLDAVLLDYPIAMYYAAPDPKLKLVGPPAGQIDYGIAVRKGNPRLVADLNAAIDGLKRSGELRRILERWNLWSPVMEASMPAGTGPANPAPANPGAAAPAVSDAYHQFLNDTRPLASWTARFQRYAGYLPDIARGALVTLEVSIVAMVVAVVVGLAAAVARRYGPAPVAWLAVTYIEIVRGTPLLIQILFIFFGLPNIGIRLDPFVAAVIALGLNYGAYEAENYRAGLQAIPHGQMEAAVALNMTQGQALRHVILPQTIRIVMPVTTNDFISLLKDSSLVSVITMTELTHTYETLSTTYYDYFGTGLLVGAVYLLIGLPFVQLARWTERRFSVELRGTGRRAMH
ncbi:MAG TPA: ABC transporter substrate-binding protein/permease [Acetobacteraceae bacterium]|nr:ABC transporter substrate-binding protein/permease [Acetobacteraceae bacterium]